MHPSCFHIVHDCSSPQLKQLSGHQPEDSAVSFVPHWLNASTASQTRFIDSANQIRRFSANTFLVRPVTDQPIRFFVGLDTDTTPARAPPSTMRKRIAFQTTGENQAIIAGLYRKLPQNPPSKHEEETLICFLAER